ncbi:MAG TPA: hypothetical protein VFG50_06025 [Rhodothermales bacterium]|nr:hypothetical protein [Rhodothermales bacterium]
MPLHTVVKSRGKHQTEDARILKHEVLDTEFLIRLALRSGLIDNYQVLGGNVILEVAGITLDLSEHDARIFLWGLVRGRERTLARLRR